MQCFRHSYIPWRNTKQGKGHWEGQDGWQWEYSTHQGVLWEEVAHAKKPKWIQGLRDANISGKAVLSQQRNQQVPSKGTALMWDPADLFQDLQGGQHGQSGSAAPMARCGCKWGCVQSGEMDCTGPSWPKTLFRRSEKLLHKSLEWFAVFTWAGEVSVPFHVNSFNLCVLIIFFKTLTFNFKMRMKRKLFQLGGWFKLNGVHCT